MLLSESDKSITREAVSKLDVEDDATVQVVSHFGKPSDYATVREDQPQLESESEFQKEADE